MNQELFYIITIIVIGYLLKRMNVLKEKDGETISRIIFNITLPALIIVSLHTVKMESSLTMLPVIVLLFGIFSIILAFWVFRKKEKELKGTFIMIASGYNVGLFVFPFVEAIWGAEGLLYFGMFDVGNSMITFGIAYLIASYYSKEGLSIKPSAMIKKFSRSIPLMSYVVMSILNVSHIHLPSGVIDIATTISKANMPLSLLLLGLYLHFSFEKQYSSLIIKYLVFRYGLGLFVGLILYFTLPFNEMFKNTLLIGFILPIGLVVIPYTHEFKYHTIKLIGTISNICIMISIILLYVFANFIL